MPHEALSNRHLLFAVRRALFTGFLAGLALATTGAEVVAQDDPYCPPAIATENVPAVPAEVIDRLRQYQHVRSAGFRGWSPDGRGMLVSTRFGDTSQLHRVYEPGGRREQLTFFEEPVGGRFLPQDEQGNLLVTLSRGGDENYQVYFMDRATGDAVLLTDGTSRNLLGPVHRAGKRIIVANNSRNGRDTDLYVADARQPGSLRLLMQTDGEYWTPGDWSRDGKRLLINHYVSINESYPALLDVETGEKQMIPVPGGEPRGERKVSFGSMAFASDGRHAYVTTDFRGEFRELARLDLDTFEYEWLTDGIAWDVSSIEVNRAATNGRSVGEETEDEGGGMPEAAFTVNEDGASGLYLLENDRPRQIELPLGIVGSLEFSPDGRHLGFTLSRPDAPADAYSLCLDEKKLTRWTYSEVGGLDTSRFVKPEQIQYRTFDGRKIPAYSFKPPEASEEKPAAVLIGIHGGPESQYRPYFNSIDQFYLNELGIAVIRPNVRGSSGYGKTYLQLDNAEKREDSVRDIGALLDWVAEQPNLDESRVAVIGGSYGGYMVLASLVHFGERLKAGVDIVGIANFITFLENTSPYRQDLRRAEYGDERDPKLREFFEQINPTSNAHRIRSALLVAHGRNDPRVPFSEAVQIAEKVRKNGRDVWTVYADNEGHSFSKKVNRDYLTAVTALFLREHLKD